ncbi:hypothetical protein EUGRSUZ_B02641 [Eucalyptus grandis]|uniref:Uncharacterized protein n=1 Tax=Eucalyptus grandis TaxID=71139 RepID=A0ACC3LVL9_EUCGR|nr:hypothetical protein EUGRSUZ_B02641 [Eucalyptus grandis]
MTKITVPGTQLNKNGKAIPLLGFGTAEYPFGSSDNVKECLLDAIRLGYRHFDSAVLYQSEQPLGEAVAEALELGLVNSREELFITTKLWCSDAHGVRVVPALQTSLKSLGLEYVDLYLVHWPVCVKAGEYELPVKKEDLLPFDYEGVWKAMEECQKLGLAKSIGVSNFSCKKLEKLLSISKIPPAVNQVCLRWTHEQGVSMLVKSFNTERMKANLDIFDWSLSPDELNKISQIPQKKGFPGVEFVSADGPYKSTVELWDGEI